jgi:dihydrofolate reductase
VTDFGGRGARLSPESAAFFRTELDRVGAFLVGRPYDLTGGWAGRPPSEAPMLVVTHDAPAEPPPTGGVPIAFATDGIEAAVAQARELAGDGVVGVAGATLARSCLDADLLDEIVVDLVPIVLGEGLPFLAGARETVRLDDPEITPAPGVTHLRFRVRR